jgi:release factor glutamine methyltransferase
MPKICQTLNWATKKLQKANIDSANLDAELLLIANLREFESESTRIDKSFLYTHPEFELTKSQIAKYKKYISRRAKSEPVAYILAHKEFFGLDFFVNKNVLIPRPETEMMVEECLTRLRPINTKSHSTKLDYGGQASILLIDIGTGSGCIPIAILKNLPVSDIGFPISVIATDISEKALAVAKKNALLHGVYKKIKFIKSDLLSFCSHNNETIRQWNNTNIIITANLPYLPEKIYKENYANLKFEPRKALVAKNNGLALYEKLLKQINQSQFKIYNLYFTLLLEILPFQKPALQKIIKKYFPNAKIKFKKDLANKWRLAIIKIKF